MRRESGEEKMNGDPSSLEEAAFQRGGLFSGFQGDVVKNGSPSTVRPRGLDRFGHLKR